jgi:ADP-ribosyl-[dinitrogen reductase] hydrolase
MSTEHANQLRNRYRGALLGLATGDALGTTLEFKPPGTFAPLSDVIGGGPFNLRAGEWTDDCSMALAWARASLSAAGSSRLTKCSGTCAGGRTAT